MISVPLPAAPIDTRLPLRSGTLEMPPDSLTTRWVRFEYRTARALASEGFSGDANEPLPLTASNAVSASVNARSALPSRMSFMLSTEAVVDCALAAGAGPLLRSSPRPAPQTKWNPPGPPGRRFMGFAVQVRVAVARRGGVGVDLRDL